MDPDQLASSKASWSGSTLFSKNNKSMFSRSKMNKYFERKIVNIFLSLKDLGQFPIQSAQILTACG